MSRVYKVRYEIDEGRFTPTEKKQITDGISVSEDNYGYADAVFLASIMNYPSDKPSVLLLSTDGGMNPSREMLRLIRDAIDHYLEEHIWE